MCAALAARSDPAEELELAVSLINRVVEGFAECGSACTSAAATGAATRRPYCRGSYQPLAPYLERMRVAAVGAGIRHRARRRPDALRGKELGWASSTRAPMEVESVAAIRARVEGRWHSTRPSGSSSTPTAASAPSPAGR